MEFEKYLQILSPLQFDISNILVEHGDDCDAICTFFGDLKICVVISKIDDMYFDVIIIPRESSAFDLKVTRIPIAMIAEIEDIHVLSDLKYCIDADKKIELLKFLISKFVSNFQNDAEYMENLKFFTKGYSVGLTSKSI